LIGRLKPPSRRAKMADHGGFLFILPMLQGAPASSLFLGYIILVATASNPTADIRIKTPPKFHLPKFIDHIPPSGNQPEELQTLPAELGCPVLIGFQRDLTG